MHSGLLQNKQGDGTKTNIVWTEGAPKPEKERTELQTIKFYTFMILCICKSKFLRQGDVPKLHNAQRVWE